MIPEVTMEKRRAMKQADLTKMLILLIAVLVVILVAVICIAVDTRTPQNTEPGTTTGMPSDTGGTDLRPSDGTTVNIGLSVQAMTDTEGGTIEEKLSFTGTSDPNADVLVNGTAIARSADGSFLCEVPLTVGKNEITFSHKGQTETFTVERRYVVESFTPADARDYNSGATIRFAVSARKGSTVTVQLNGQTISLKEAESQQGSGTAEGFVLLTGEYKLPGTNTSDLELGNAVFTAVCDGITETYTSGTLRCLKSTDILASDPAVTPPTGGYINVGSGYIVEVIAYTAETFDGKTIDDYSHPTNNYLPTGTVDYCPTSIVENGRLKYVVLRSGQRVYLQKKDTITGKYLTVVDRYTGKLPDHNEIGVASMTDTGKHLVLTLDTLWKAPFYFDLEPQTYQYPNGGSNRNYSVTACTAQYVDIRFCYATKFTGTIQLPENNPLFSSAEVINNGPDHTLRLYLKKVGAFYGWDSYYNDKDQLCFRFLKPAAVTVTENAYGADLTGVTVMIDVGHGGMDGGATLRDANGKDLKDANGNYIDEAAQNLKLALKLKAELESIGATVILNRENDSLVLVDERLQMLKSAAPDLCICIHHNAVAGYPNINGLITYYYTPFSQAAAKEIYKANEGSSVYQNNGLDWHYYYTARQPVCPVVLMENGYTTSPHDVSHMLNDESVQIKAQAMAQGIVNYFLLINK